MRVQLLHLSGPLRGNTDTYQPENVLIGTDPDATVKFPEGCGVQPRHAEIAYVEEDCAFYLRRIGGDVFINQKEVQEIILEKGDLIEIGKNGPRARFKVYADPGRVCKPVRLMLDDARDVGKASGVFAFTHSMAKDLLTQATWQLKVGVPLLVLIILLPTAILAGWFGGTQTREDIDELLAELRAQQDELVSREEIEVMRADFATRAARIDRLIASDVALQRIHNVYSRGVCLIHGIYGLKRMQGEVIEYLSSGPAGDPVALEYTGSGFLVTAEGHIATNRHVAVPWEFDQRVSSLLDHGWEPEFQRIMAYFPGHGPIPVLSGETRLRDDRIDVAIIKIESAEELPVLPLSSAAASASLGQGIAVVGFPTGINALLAKADEDLARSLSGPGSSMTSIIDGLALNGAVSPIITRGALNEVLEGKLVYDAGTTSGGSGGPVFGSEGRVIGVNFAILRGFAGSNFGVPVRYLREIMPQ
ncbi:MAG: trypsin-like peptidase domain-containing protein [Planctomycetota bacterium]|jgi:S1-C subfamily serine protease